jgi:hypothetical protein
MSDGVETQQSNKSPDPASRFLVGILGALSILFFICAVALVKPFLVRGIRRFETAHQQSVVVDVDRTIEKRRLARRPRLRECWIDDGSLEGERVHSGHAARLADLQVRPTTRQRSVFP